LTRNDIVPFLQSFEEFESYFAQVMNGHADKLDDTMFVGRGIANRIVSFVKERFNG